MDWKNEMNLSWDDLTVGELKELSQIAEQTCGLEITASGDGHSGRVRSAV